MSVPTIFALSSGRPPAAIAVIRISGPDAHRAGALLAGELPRERQAGVRTLRTQGGELLDEALVLRFDGPATATGEDLVELHCHGSRAVVDAVLASLSAIEGLKLAEPGEFTRRAFENGRIDLTEAEGLADLLEAETETQRKAALAISEGGLRRQVARWQHRVLELSARAEAAIDYVDEDGLGEDHELSSDCAELARELKTWLDRPAAEPLRDGVKVVFAGPPNAGKSSLLNAIAGYERAIVTEVAGTTRDEIELPIALGGIPFVFIDTAGLRSAEDRVEQIGVDRAFSAMDRADILLWLGDPDAAPSHARLIRVHSKCDVRRTGSAGSVAVSAKSGEGLGSLIDAVIRLAGDLMPGEGELALNRRQAEALASASEALQRASGVDDPELIADDLRSARLAFDRLTGRAGTEDLLDELFGRFCLGK